MLPFGLAPHILLALAEHLTATSDQEPPLADYYGFGELEVIRIGREAGPMLVQDMNGDGLNDLVVVNNFASRIEIHYQRPGASPNDPVTAPSRVNEFPEHWRFAREHFSVTHRVTALAAHDFDADGQMDLIYAGQPTEIVFLRQNAGDFRQLSRHRVRNLSSSRGAIRIADVLGDSDPELIALVEGQVHIWPLNPNELGAPTRFIAGSNMQAMFINDFTGNGALDLLGVVPEDAAPIRAWLGTCNSATNDAVLGPQVRFELPAIRELTAVRLPKSDAALMAVIERTSRRISLLEIGEELGASASARDAAYHVFSFTDPGSRDRKVIVANLSSNIHGGPLSVIATDRQANAVAIFHNEEGRGLQPAVLHPSLADLDYIAAGKLGATLELFVLSESEGVVGRSPLTGEEGGMVPFPKPIQICEGHTPVAMNLIALDDRPHLAIVAKDGRSHVVDLIDGEGRRRTVELGDLTRSPETILAIDADQDGLTDLLLFTRDRPMMMLRAGEEGFTLIQSNEMGQFGLVQEARTENTATLDIDGNGHEELLIADRNYIRAVRYETDPAEGISPGWQVVRQINADDPRSQLISISVYGGRIFAADREGNRIIIIDGNGFGETPTMQVAHVRGFSFDAIHAGPVAPDSTTGIVAVGSEGFAVLMLSGSRAVLREVDAWRSSDENQVHFQLAAGDVNSDGFTDLISFDAGEQMCDILTFTRSGRLLHATSFATYESRIFTGGTAREFEPNQAIVADVTGDGADDLVMVAHDRILIYPQMTEPLAEGEWFGDGP